jgi:hypothetical protein
VEGQGSQKKKKKGEEETMSNLLERYTITTGLDWSSPESKKHLLTAMYPGQKSCPLTVSSGLDQTYGFHSLKIPERP